MLKTFIFILLYINRCCFTTSSERKFPKDFRFGASSSAYQIEGAWNLSDKGESTWDHYTHQKPEKIADHSNGDIACDSYHLYKRDVEMLVELGVNFYRFSISWTRLLPKGFGYLISEDGLRYYNNLINELIKHDIQPVITMFHWDTPQVFQVMGGWTNDIIVDYFEDYARILYEKFGDRVKEWVTFNEPYNMCLYGYGTEIGMMQFAPGDVVPGVAEYLCAHNVLKAHARAFRLYDEKFRSTQKGKIGMASCVFWAEPETNSTEDIAIAEKGIQFNTGWFFHPIYSENGDYPPIMREEIDEQSRIQGFTKSRLPKFTEQEVNDIKGTFDFIGINYYTSLTYKNLNERPTKEVPSYDNDLGYEVFLKPEWESASAWLQSRPQGLHDTLNWIVKQYGNQEIFILENGFSTSGGLVDVKRIRYIKSHLSAVLDAIDDGCNITSYSVWSLMDNFEWLNGYTEVYGLYEVDFNSPKRTRTPRLSAKVYSDIIKTKTLDIKEPQQIFESETEHGIKWFIITIGFSFFAVVIIFFIKRVLIKKPHIRLPKKKDLEEL